MHCVSRSIEAYIRSDGSGVLAQKQAVAQQIIGAALQAGDSADAALQAGSERSTAHLTQAARSLLDQAGEAQAVRAWWDRVVFTYYCRQQV